MRVPYSGALVIRNLSAFGSFRISGLGPLVQDVGSRTDAGFGAL